MNGTTVITFLKQNRIFHHILFWLVITVGYGLLAGFFLNPWYEPYLNKLGYLPAQILVAYTLIYYLIPRHLKKGKYAQFILSTFLLTYLGTVVARICKVYWYESLMKSDLPKDSLWEILSDPIPLGFQYIWWIYHFPLLMLLIKYLIEHFEEERRMLLLEKEKAHAELSFLKAQIHPHFLFNTLNNLYTLALDQSDHAPTMVKKLSGLLDYMLHYAGQTSVDIQKEIWLIQNYIDLELLRYGDRLDLSFNYEMDDPNARIAPLILLSVVENAFKHGASGDPGQPQIHIELVVVAQQLQFKVFNSKPQHQQSDPRNYKAGIGTKNVRKQLALIYPKVHQLNIRETDETYEVLLTINLNGQKFQSLDSVWAVPKNAFNPIYHDEVK